MKEKLDELVQKYETKDFIKDDPVQFPHRYKNENMGLEDIEIAGFIAALFAYGRREVFIKKLDFLFSSMKEGPHAFLLEYPQGESFLDGFCYRFVKDFDIKSLFHVLSKLYKDKSSLGELFKGGAQNVADYFYANASPNSGMGFYHLIPDPKKGGAQKRMNMLLRWMTREGPVDLGVWDFKKKSDLLIPLDTHVGNVSRSLFLLKRNSNDFRAVVELTQKLKSFDQKDPVKYDFALFGAGVDKNFNL